MTRTLGATRDCNGCRFWSEMIAMSIGGGGVQAMCLSGGSPHAGKYTYGRLTCDAWKSGHLGAVDDPPNYGEATRAAYAEQEAAKHPNGAPMFSPDGMMLDDKGNRSVFDDIDADDGFEDFPPSDDDEDEPAF